MGRDEAVKAYLDVLLGFRGDYRRFTDAAGTLSDEEKTVLESAVSEIEKKCFRRTGSDFS